MNENWKQLQQTQVNSHATVSVVGTGKKKRGFLTILIIWSKCRKKKQPNLLPLPFCFSRTTVHKRLFLHQDKYCAKQWASCQYCEWPTGHIIILRKQQPTNLWLPERNCGNSDLPFNLLHKSYWVFTQPPAHTFLFLFVFDLHFQISVPRVWIF